MNIESMIHQSSSHFEEHYAHKRSAGVVFAHYMIDEFQHYSKAAHYLKGKIDPNLPVHPKFRIPTEAFYVWYYINYVSISKETAATQYKKWEASDWRIDFDFWEPGAGEFESIAVRPIRLVKNNNSALYEICQSQYAELWGVFTRKTTGEMINIVRCINEITAYCFAGNLNVLIANWQIKVLIDIKDASIQEIFSTHTLKFASIDRDVMEDTDNISEMFREQDVPLNAIASEFYNTIPIYSKEDEAVKELLKQIGF